jgi:hypothetical protein
MQESQTSSTKYDYGGIKTYYSKNTGLQFSVKNEEDKKIMKKIQELKNNEDNNNRENKILKMFN